MTEKQDFIKELTKINGIGKAKAEEIYKKGFTTSDKLKKATIKDLTSIEGISSNLANEIKKQYVQEKKEKPEKAKPSEKKTRDKKTEEKKKKEEKSTAKKKEVETEEEEIEEEEKYIVKKKPKISTELKHKLQVRKKIKKRSPTFLREEWYRYKRIPRNWRRPDGITSKMRINLKYRPSKVRVGFRGPREVRGLHPSGFEEVMVYNVEQLNDINPEIQAVRIGSGVGTKKRLDIEKEAEKKEIRVLNP